ncbi:diguanylate cyclase (GGDEF)-like protein [Actimicrobium sp. GrIS 1.19]|uniref:GGDEF domain-containing protein n=1 Tax=Actimicrobium sp. GrIS 1.19 TaxID=3071708 RepID=UPI002E06F360|nr:diguanylate cyclase (GGDEF)-like protein [Actimicrobium sp. GrIS 1.19]
MAAATKVIDTLSEQSYHDFVRAARALCGASLALINLLDQDGQWQRAHAGVALTQALRTLPPDFVARADGEKLLMVEDIHADPRFADSALRQLTPRIAFCAVAMLADSEGVPIGSLLVFDPAPLQLSDSQHEALCSLARQVVAQLEARRCIARLEDMLERLEIISATDALTGLQNRRALEDRISQEFDRARRYDAPLSFLMLDVDFFKQFNTRNGHLAGDRMLGQIATVLQQATRGQDTLARFGGEEFAVVLPNTRRDGALVLAERYRAAIEAMAVEGVTVSIGVATMTPSMLLSTELVGEADRALYCAKDGGRNRVIGAGN